MESLLMLLFPLIGALVIRLIPDRSQAQKAAFLLSLIPLADILWKMVDFNPDGGTQFLLDQYWMKDLGISFKFGLDGLSLLMVLLTASLVPLIIYSASGHDIPDHRNFYSLVFFMQFALTGVFSALDGFLFYVFWELALIPIWFICLLWGGGDRIRITVKFFIYTLSGSLLMLVGLIWLYLQTPGQHSFDIDALYALSLAPEHQDWLFWLFFAAFAIKIPIWPLHTWQPDTYTMAPAQGTMLLSGIMLKMGIYGVLRWMLPVLPQGMETWSAAAMTLAAIGVIYASAMAIAQKDFKRMIAYSSMAHVGLIGAGVFSMNLVAMQGAAYQMLSHGINAVGLFFIAEILHRRMKKRNMDEMGGIVHASSPFAVAFMVILLGSVALPLTNGFIGEFLLFAGIYQSHPWLTAFAGISVILGAVYMLRAYQRIMLGGESDASAAFSPLTFAEQSLLVLIVALVVVMGIYPKPLLDIAEPSLRALLSRAGMSM